MCNTTLIAVRITFRHCNTLLFDWLPSLRYGRSARPRHRTPALLLLHHSPVRRALPHCLRPPHSVLATPPLLVSFLSLLCVQRISLFLTIFSPFLQLYTNLLHSFCLCNTMCCFPLLSLLPPSLLPSLTPLLTGAEHTIAPSLSSPEPELLSLSPFFLLSQSESTFPNCCFPKSHSFLWRLQSIILTLHSFYWC